MRINRQTVTTALLVVLLSACLSPQEPCKFGYGSEKASDQLEAALKRAPTCDKAADILSKCVSGSSADLEFASIVIEKCERSLLPKLTAAGNARYKRERELCAYEFEDQHGTLFLSEEAMCEVDIAQRFAGKPSLAEAPAPRASFVCAKAITSLEKAICSDDKLGRADIVLERAYRPVLRSTPAAKRSKLITQQKAWLSQVERKCGVGSSPLDLAARECVRKEFEIRFAQLDGCGADGPEDCLNEPPDDKQ